MAATGYSRTFFTLLLGDDDLSIQPHLAIPLSSSAQFALELGDNGFASIGVERGDFLLFSTTSLLRPSGQVALIRQEDECIIREAYWSGDTTVLRVPGERYEALTLPTENIRIAAVLDNVIKNNELAPIVRF